MDKEQLAKFEQTAEMAQGKDKRINGHVHFHIPGEVFLIVTIAIVLIALLVLVEWAINHPADFSSTSYVLVHGSIWLITVGATIGLAWLAIKVVVQPLIEVGHRVTDMVGKWKRHKVLAQSDTYAITQQQDGPQFHTTVAHVRSREEITPPAQMASQAQLPAPGQPTQAYAISQLQENGLQVCLGTSKTTGKPFVRDLIGGTHYNIIGASNMGKSCFAGSILDQVTTTNDPDHLLIGLLDLEHKTSRLFENLPHLAEIDLGRKRVDCIAQTPDEVGEHFGYLHQELDRRTRLSEYDLIRERFLLIYVEEFLSLKYEIDPKLLDKMMADFSILALRGRKYKLYLLACAQVSYADKQLREAQAQFNVRASFSVPPSAARAAGFISSPLLKTNFEQKQYGQLVLETTGCNDIMLAPQYDVRYLLQQLDRSTGVQHGFKPLNAQHYNSSAQNSERAAELSSGFERSERSGSSEQEIEMIELDGMGWNKKEIVEKVFKCTKGGSKAWQDGAAFYDAVMASKKIGA